MTSTPPRRSCDAIARRSLRARSAAAASYTAAASDRPAASLIDARVGNRGDQHMVSGRQLRQHRQQALVESGRVEVGQQHHQRSPPGAPQDGGNHCMPVGFDKRRSQRGHGIDQLGKQFATRGAKHAGAADPVVGQEVDMVAGS